MNQKPDESSLERYPSGAVRSSKKGKGRYDLIPSECLRRIALMYERGLQGPDGNPLHEERNWERGIPVSSFYNSAMRHLLSWFEGKADEDHLAQLVFNVFGLMEMERRAHRRELPFDLLDLKPVADKVSDAMFDDECIGDDEAVSLLQVRDMSGNVVCEGPTFEDILFSPELKNETYVFHIPPNYTWSGDLHLGKIQTPYNPLWIVRGGAFHIRAVTFYEDSPVLLFENCNLVTRGTVLDCIQVGRGCHHTEECP